MASRSHSHLHRCRNAALFMLLPDYSVSSVTAALSLVTMSFTPSNAEELEVADANGGQLSGLVASVLVSCVTFIWLCYALECSANLNWPEGAKFPFKVCAKVDHHSDSLQELSYLKVTSRQNCGIALV